MALARLALKNLRQRVLISRPDASVTPAASLLVGRNGAEVDTKRCVSTEGVNVDPKVAGESDQTTTDHGKEVANTQTKSLFSKKPRTRRRGLWRSRNDRDIFIPPLFEFFPSGLGNALIEASENVKRVLESLNVSPWSLSMRVKEQNDCYKLSFDVPGLRKEDLKVVVDDGVLVINGEHKEEENKGSESDHSDDDASYSRRMYGYYHTSLALPEDAKVDEIRAELKNGVLCVVVPRSLNQPKKEVKDIQIQ